MGSPSTPRDLFNEGGEVFDAEPGTPVESFKQLDNDDRNDWSIPKPELTRLDQILAAPSGTEEHTTSLEFPKTAIG